MKKVVTMHCKIGKPTTHQNSTVKPSLVRNDSRSQLHVLIQPKSSRDTIKNNVYSHAQKGRSYLLAKIN